MKKKIRIIEKVLPSLEKSFESCDLCVRNCGVDRSKGVKGFCEAGDKAIVYSYSPHHGEEPPVSGARGSGTIFFSRCSMSCKYCQNYQFSQTSEGKEVSCEELGDIMLELQEMRCHNINLVTPTHFMPVIARALKHAYSHSLSIPVVYNTGGYDSMDAIRALDGVVEVYLPDMRYSSDIFAERYSSAPGYVGNNRRIVKEMHKQAGSLKMCDGVASRGLMIRLLILPGGISGTEDTLGFISREAGKETYLSVMSQYYPAYMAKKHAELSRRINREEYSSVITKMHQLGMNNGWVQPFEGEFDGRFAGENFESNL
ncbi:MAG: 4Fe-4S cluster-binding domain-containing protein [Candidatus Omnitrophica bacterium]|nr:4Fe-4S cluster-binding domain-containing protein [Candidatus Omnitrophota bacterium]